MGNVTGVMKQVNEHVSTEEIAKTMQQFAVENERMAMTENMMDDALIDAVSFSRGVVRFPPGIEMYRPVTWPEKCRISILIRPIFFLK